MNKKIFLSFLLVMLVAISVTAVSADDSADVIAIDDNSEALSAPVQPTANTSQAVQDAVDTADDTVDLSVFSEYDFTNKTVTISKEGLVIDGKGTTTIYGTGDGQGIFAITAKNVIIQGINFIDTNPKNDFKYNGTVKGWGISATGANGGLIKDCTFKDFNSGVVVMGTTGFTIEYSNFTGGYVTKLLNDPTVNKEEGTKALNIYRQSSQVSVRHNIFNGTMLDAVSIAQGSGKNLVENNIFIGNCYSIYFGGASTKGTKVKDNTFINCGFFKEGSIDWQGLPIISIQKSSDGIALENNTFQAVTNNILIAGEAGNEAHGAATRMGDINITGNTVVAYDAASDMATVTLFRVLVRDGSSFQMDDALNVTNNTFPKGVKGISIWFDNHEIFSADESVITDTLYPACIYGTQIKVSDLTLTAGDQGSLKITLLDSNNTPLRDKQLLISINGKSIVGFTDVDGVFTLSVKENSAMTEYVTVMYMGEGSIYGSSMASAKVTIKAKPVPPVVAKKTTLTAKKVTFKVKKAKKVSITLKANGKAVAGKKITIKVNKKTFSAKTNAKGIAKIKVKITKKGKFTAVVKFAGDKAYKSVTKKVNYTVTQ